MYKTKPCGPCAMPAPDIALRVLVLNCSLKHQPDVSNTGELSELVLASMKEMHRNLARNTLYYAQLLKERPLVPELVPANG